VNFVNRSQTIDSNPIGCLACGDARDAPGGAIGMPTPDPSPRQWRSQQPDAPI